MWSAPQRSGYFDGDAVAVSLRCSNANRQQDRCLRLSVPFSMPWLALNLPLPSPPSTHFKIISLSHSTFNRTAHVQLFMATLVRYDCAWTLAEGQDTGISMRVSGYVMYASFVHLHSYSLARQLTNRVASRCLYMWLCRCSIQSRCPG